MKNIVLKSALLVALLVGLFFTACKKDEFSPIANSNDVSDIKMCTERRLPSVVEDRAIGSSAKFWTNGQTIRIKMIGGSSYVRSKVQQYASQWLIYANLNFSWVASGNADIRITFTPGGSWSYVGKDALGVPQADPTMNYGWFNDNTADIEFRRTTLHEFGHALGLVHEHQHPFNGIPWDIPAVYAYYLQTSGWNQSDVNSNVLSVYGTNGMSYTSFDPSSIMEYAVPNSITIGNYEIGWNTELSAVDKSFIRGKYPIPLISGGTYKLTHKGTNQCLDVVNNSSAPGANVQQWTDNGNNAQRWIVTLQSDGHFKLTHKGTNQCLDVANNLPTPGTNVGQWTDNGNDAQRWAIQLQLDGSYKLTHKGTNQCLDVVNNSSTPGANVQQWTDNGNNAQRWIFTKY